jgi:uncharacterized protein (DUF1800 family)
MPSDPSTPRPEPGPEVGVDELQTDIEATRAELGETVEALSAKADISGRAKQKVADTQATIADKATHAKDAVAEKAVQAKDAVVEKTHAAQSAARDFVTDDTGSMKPAVKQSVPIAAVVAAVGVVVIGVLVWRRRR